MTVVGLLQAARREWVALFIGLGLTAAALVSVAFQGGMYWSRSDVYMLRPVGAGPNGLASTPQAAIRFAGLVQREITGGPAETDTVADRVRIVDVGIRDGYLVRLPNDGNQYGNNFNRALLDVQVSGPTEAVVRRRMDALLEEIRVKVTQRQARMGVPIDSQIRARPTPRAIQVFHEAGEPKRALAGTLTLGLGLTWAVIVLTAARRARAEAGPNPNLGAILSLLRVSEVGVRRLGRLRRATPPRVAPRSRKQRVGQLRVLTPPRRKHRVGQPDVQQPAELVRTTFVVHRGRRK